ncbi:MAG: glutamine--fructose-6-phosphate transaminase (isomerizing) [Candidatus Staskawiczbacteria bacterium]|nr:glutamine--fructose-6-phosphate transaminase (isomerizing) [Candidatus Staskawiczbacteria bacterium]
MCGIIGYIGKEQALPLLMEGLRRQSYRGYDSSGVVVFDGKDANFAKAAGKLEKLEEKITGQSFPGTVGIGHTRWATHGGLTDDNAHPHTDCKQNIFVVHNGIFENYQILKEKLQAKGHVFTSETDTEVLPHLIEQFFKGNLEEAVRKALKLIKGAYGIAVFSREDPDKIIVARFSAPLVVSMNTSGVFAASDPAAILSHSNKMVFLDDGEMAVLTRDGFSITDLKNNIKEKAVTEIEWTLEEAEKGGHAHFMLKEILEHPMALENVLRGRLLADEGRAKLGGLESIKDKLRDINRIQIIACGGSAYAAGVGEYMLEEYGGIPTKVEVGSEFRYRKPVFDNHTLSIFISQSGETADTLAALKEVKERGGLSIGVVNVVGSTLARETGFGVYTRSGPEIAVASTKTFTAQITALVLIALFLGRQRQLSLVTGQHIAKELLRLPQLVQKIIAEKQKIEEIAKKYYQYSNFCVIGRKYNYGIALEGALKLKEVAYIHAEGMRSGELKHGSLALINEEFPTIAIVPSDSVYEKNISSIQQVKARGGKVIAIATEGNEDIKKIADDVIYIPKTLEMLTPILATVPLHLFAYYVAVMRGCEIDKPRNLAKSVTVE